jgi:foldase protein PrsA
VKRISSRLAAAPLLVVLAASLVLTACSSTGAPAAATVNGTDISRRTLQDDLQALVGNKDLREKLQQSQSFAGTKISTAAVPAVLTAQWLQTLVNQTLIEDAVHSRDITVTDSDRAAARSTIEQSSGFGPKASFEKYPKWFQDRVVAQQANATALRTALEKETKTTDAVLQRFYKSNQAQLCPSGKLVSHILVQTEAEAQAIEAQLAQGASFDELAKSKSIDTQTGVNGGRLTCIGSQDWSSIDETFRTAAEGLAVGQVSAPVQTQYGYHLIRVQDFTFENAKPLIKQLIEQQVDPLQALLRRQVRRADIWVDPRYGRVSKAGGNLEITAPKARTPKSKPPATASTTTTAPSTAGG